MAEDQKTALNFNQIKHLLPPNYSDMEISELEKLAGQGDLEAMRKLVEKLSPQSQTFLISDSDKPTPNPEEAFKWALKLCEMGDPQGRHWLADCYFTGQFVNKADSKEAIGLLQKNAEEGDYLAYVRLAYYYAHGKGVEQSFRTAIEWLEKMIAYEDAEPGFKPHQYFSYRKAAILPWQFCPEFTYCYEEPRYKLAELYLQGGLGIVQDFGKAVEWLEKAIDWTNIPFEEKCRAQFTIGKCYLTGGPGLERSYTKAIDWFKEIPEPAKQLRKEDIVGNLWFCYLKSVETEELRDETKYVPRLFRTAGNPFHQPNEDEKLSWKIDEIEWEIDSRLRSTAVCFEKLVREEGYIDLDMLDESKSNVVIEFLQNRPHVASTYPSQIILAFYYKSIGSESQFLSCLEKASADCNDIIANYVLGTWYERQARDQEKEIDFLKLEKAIDFLKKVVAKKNTDSSSYSSQGSYVNSSELALKDIKLEIANEELKSKNTELELARQKLTELVRSTSHTAGNLLRPNTQAKIAKRLKDINLQEDANKLYYAASDIKYVKLQFKLLEIMQTLTGSQSVIDQIQLDRVEKDDDRAMNIDDILNMAAFRAIDKVFDQYEYSLDFARETLRKTVKDFEELSDSYQDLVLKMDEKPSVIRWCSEHLRSIRINYECDTWKELYFHENSQTVALFFCYFFELFFNAFKYADHNTADFLTVTLGMETIDNQDFLTMHWQNPVGTQKSFGSGKGLNLSESYIGLLNDDAHRNLSQEIAGFSGNVFELIVRISKKNMLGE